MEPIPSGTDGSSHSPPDSGGWSFPLLLTILLIALIGAFVFMAPSTETVESSSSAGWTPSAQPPGTSAALTIDFGNGATKVFEALPCLPDMTVADLMQAAHAFRPGIEFTQKGSGASGFLTSLDGLANEGAGGRNWIYQVDGRHAVQSYCLEKIQPGMHVLWTFTDQLYNDPPAEQ
ncbi:MAG: DUF4430 domain-containing protein [Planctomycetota bacterium]